MERLTAHSYKTDQLLGRIIKFCITTTKNRPTPWLDNQNLHHNNTLSHTIPFDKSDLKPKTNISVQTFNIL
jgi:hypothetical protein